MLAGCVGVPAPPREGAGTPIRGLVRGEAVLFTPPFRVAAGRTGNGHRAPAGTTRPAPPATGPAWVRSKPCLLSVLATAGPARAPGRLD